MGVSRLSASWSPSLQARRSALVSSKSPATSRLCIGGLYLPRLRKNFSWPVSTSAPFLRLFEAEAHMKMILSAILAGSLLATLGSPLSALSVASDGGALVRKHVDRLGWMSGRPAFPRREPSR